MANPPSASPPFTHVFIPASRYRRHPGIETSACQPVTYLT
jgi:hypothetical protein